MKRKPKKLTAVRLPPEVIKEIETQAATQWPPVTPSAYIRSLIESGLKKRRAA